ncbi:MAG: CZB domain-containing protein [Thermonemataceae bacterium]|nr:CZB domain-containing protein [Thermonemataceae bacterium]
MNLDFTLAKSKHLAWRIRLMSFLRGEETLTLDQVVSHQHCDLGKWIYSEGIEKYSHLPSMKELEYIHQQIHISIRGVVELKNEGKEEEAEKEYEKMKEISDIIVKLIDALEQESKVISK